MYCRAPLVSCDLHTLNLCTDISYTDFKFSCTSTISLSMVFVAYVFDKNA